MEKTIGGIILRVPYEKMGSTADIEILGKTMLDWVALSLGGAPYKSVDYNDSVSLPVLIRPYLDRESEYTVVLYSDTPLITKKTVLDAIAELNSSRRNVVRMTRGYVFKTAFILGADRLYTEDTVYFDEEDFVTAFNFKQVGLISDILKNRILNFHMENGVHFEDLSSTFVGCDAVIGRGVTVGPGNIIKGNTIIKDNVRLLPNNLIDCCIIDEWAVINSSQLNHSYIGKRTTVGPYAYIRPDCVVGEGCRIGDFVELKKSVIGNGSKISHLTYVGDCEMGENCNVGCGVVFANYDGKDKYKSIVGSRVFIGSNSNIIAPVTLADNAFVAAGSTLTDDVPERALAIARARQVNKPDWQGNKFSKD